MKKRYLEKPIAGICFAAGKMAFLAGARQAGKTTLAKQLLHQRGVGEYYNWDALAFRKLWAQSPSSVLAASAEGLGTNDARPLIVLDEIHKAKKWKQNLKGVYDTMAQPCDILVTGSARLNTYRKGSDSLMGRYFYFKLHPFSMAELLARKHIPHDDLWGLLLKEHAAPTAILQTHQLECLQQLDAMGPFPEPYLIGKKSHWRLWRRGRVEKIVREDLRDLSRSLELSQIEMLVALLPERVASPLSMQSLSEDLEVSYATVKRWMQYLYDLYYCFEIKPYAQSLSRSIKKEGKMYLWDWSEVESEGARFENLVACHLLKYCDYLTDTGEGLFELRHLKNKDKKEIDFLILKDHQPWLPVEVKLSETTPSSHWATFLKLLPIKHGVQVVKKSGVHRVHAMGGHTVLVMSAAHFLYHLV